MLHRVCLIFVVSGEVLLDSANFYPYEINEKTGLLSQCTNVEFGYTVQSFNDVHHHPEQSQLKESCSIH